jgi:KDO2-lipid IV(A) lauroyltransferase
MKLRDLVEYVPARAAEAALAGLPGDISTALGSGAGRVAWRVGTRRRVVVEQLGAAFPDCSPSWVADTAAACYRHFGRETAEIARLGRTGGAALLDRVALGEDAVALHHRTTSGGGALIVTGHVGNWEVAGSYLAAAGLAMAAVVKRQRNTTFDRRLLDTRRLLGIEPIYMEDARIRIPEALGQGKTVALVADQDAGRRGTFVPFMGRLAATFRGPARLALAHEVPLFFGAAIRDGAGYRAVLERVEPPAPAEGAEDEMTRRWVVRLEAQVRRHPDQYFWFHRRWKTRPRGTTGPVERYSGDKASE